jgi:hypothetical protein
MNKSGASESDEHDALVCAEKVVCVEGRALPCAQGLAFSAHRTLTAAVFASS